MSSLTLQTMQYPEIQFYRGSLVRLASGKLKQVEDLSSDDFIESARLAASNVDKQPKSAPPYQLAQTTTNICNTNQTIKFDFNPLTARDKFDNRACDSSGTLDENNNSVFNSPEPMSSSDNSPRMETDEFYDNDDEIDVVLDVVSHENETNHQDQHEDPIQNVIYRQTANMATLRVDLGERKLENASSTTRGNSHSNSNCNSNSNNNSRSSSSSSSSSSSISELECGLNLSSHNEQNVSVRNLKIAESDEQITMDSSWSSSWLSQTSRPHSSISTQHMNSTIVGQPDNTPVAPASAAAATTTPPPPLSTSCLDQDNHEFYIDSSVVRDFLEVGPISRKMPAEINKTTSRTHQSQLQPISPVSPTSSLTSHLQDYGNRILSNSTMTAATSSQIPNCSLSPSTPPIVVSQPPDSTSQTVLIKFFLETSRSVAFIEVPIEHPFFVLHRGWSSWNPQRTYDKFGLKCRKLKIGDTCISLIRRRLVEIGRRPPNEIQKDSDHCNIMFSSIKIDE